jgi:ligand-binding SRPBCC domain-containing protein
MKVYTINKTQILPITLEESWDFFATPANLPKITPPYMDFRILHISGQENVEIKKMYAGQFIRYSVCPFPFPKIPLQWITEITHVQEPYFFVDEQRDGPYNLWHHQHFFKEVPGGVEVSDEVNYSVPLGPLGVLANHLFVSRQVNSIFDYREKALNQIFKQIE